MYSSMNGPSSPQRENGNTGLPYLGPDIEANDAATLPAGVYLAEILYIVLRKDKQRVDAVFDVKAGPHAGCFAELQASRDWTHTIYLSFKPNALRFTQLAIKAISEANPGFDGFEAWNNQLRKFDGKLVFLIASHREAIDNYGEPETLCSFRAVSPSALKAGRFTIPGMQHADGTREPNAPGKPVDVDALLAEARGEEKPGIRFIGATGVGGGGPEGSQQGPATPNPLWNTDGQR